MPRAAALLRTVTRESAEPAANFAPSRKTSELFRKLNFRRVKCAALAARLLIVKEAQASAQHFSSTGGFFAN